MEENELQEETKASSEDDQDWKIEAFVCTYCTYTAADMAGSQRLQYPTTVRVVKYLCTGKVEVVHILKAFEAGADAVFVGG
jgi:coenzyme F420-reducing hydrogenase delta subunit